MTTQSSPIITEMKVIPVAGHDNMLLNIGGAHNAWFTRNIVVLTDNAGHTGVGEAPGGEVIYQTLLAAIPQICTIMGMIYWSRHSDKHQERKHHTALPFLFAAAGWLLASATDHNLIQLLGIVMASTGSFSAMAIFWTTPDQSISLRARAIGIAVINATGNIGSALSPFMIGWLKDITGSFSSGLWFVAALLIIGAVIIWAIPMKGSRPRATP